MFNAFALLASCGLCKIRKTIFGICLYLFMVYLATLSIALNYIASNSKMVVNKESERVWKKAAVTTVFKYYPGICLEELKKATTNLNQDNRCRAPRNVATPVIYILLETQLESLVVFPEIRL
jgi:hypothetical protein